MLNYLKVITGSIAGHDFDHHVILFNDADPEGARAAVKRARELRGEDGAVSVWKRAPMVPGYIPQVGESPAGGGVLQPGQVTATRAHSTGLVGKVAA